MRRPGRAEPHAREPQSERPQPLAGPGGVQRPQNFQDEDEEDAVRRAGACGGGADWL